MSDKYTESSKLYVGLTDSEDKLKKFSLPNPRNDVTESEIRSAIENLITNVGIIDSTTDEPFSTSSITTSYIENVEKTEFDLGN